MNRAEAIELLATKGLDRETFLDQMQSRQMLYMGRDRCVQLRKSVVAMAGFGGGGGMTLEMLARAGVGRFRLLDMDAFDPTNLNRQILATIETLDRPKAQVAAERIAQINPFAEVEMVIDDRAREANIERLIDGADLGLVCTDSPSSQRFFQKSAMKHKVPLLCGWCMPKGCGIWVMDYSTPPRKSVLKNNPLLRKLFRRPQEDEFLTLDEQQILALDEDCHRDGPPASIGYSANFSACLMASVAVKFLTGMDRRPHKVQFNFDTMQPY